VLVGTRGVASTWLKEDAHPAFQFPVEFVFSEADFEDEALEILFQIEEKGGIHCSIITNSSKFWKHIFLKTIN